MPENAPKAVSLDNILRSSSFDFTALGRRQAKETLDAIQERISGHSEHVKILTEHVRTIDEHLQEHPEYTSCPRVYASRITPEKIGATYSLIALKIMISSMNEREFQLYHQHIASWETDVNALDRQKESEKLRKIVEQRKQFIEGKLAKLVPGEKQRDNVPFITGVLEREKAECRRIRGLRTELLAAHPHLAETRQG